MSNLTVVQNGAIWPWDPAAGITSVEFRPISGLSGTQQQYQMYDVSNSQAMYQTQGHLVSNSHAYDIKSDGNVWSDHGFDFPGTFAVSSSTTAPSTSSASVTATASNKYLHIFCAVGYVGYIDVWTPFNSSGGGGGFLSTSDLQWEGSFVKNSGQWTWNVSGFNSGASDYIYLYDQMPTLTSTHSAVATMTFTTSSSSSSQSLSFTPDATKTYYIINYLSGGSSTNLNEVVLATRNFAVKVSCNFW